MKRIFIHPLWVHVPAVGLIGGIAYAVAEGTITLNPWSVALLGVQAVLMICLSIYGDELWARQEQRKSFNWLSPIDEVLVGLMAGVIIGPPWTWAAPVSAAAAAVVLELLRPYRSSGERATGADAHELLSLMKSLTAQGRKWTYWDVQNPSWLSWAILATVVFLVGPAIPTLSESPPLAALLLLLAAGMVGLYGGMHTVVTAVKIEVRLGVYRVLRLTTADVTEVDLREFSPLREFGGYGIRIGAGGIRAFFLRGNGGVLLTLSNGRKYLIGSDHPERLAAAIQAAVEQK